MPVIRVTTCKNVKELIDTEMELIPARRSEEIIKEKGMEYSLRERMRICNRGELCDYTAEEIRNRVLETVIKGILVQITFVIKGVPFKNFYDMEVSKVELEDKAGNIILSAHELVEYCETDTVFLPCK